MADGASVAPAVQQPQQQQQQQQQQMDSDTTTSEVDYGILTDTARRKSRSHSLKDCHVQFDAVSIGRSKSDEASITPVWRGDRNVEVQLGFLQFLHKYEVNFSLEGPFQKLRNPHSSASSSSSATMTTHSVDAIGSCSADTSPAVEPAGETNARVISVETKSDEGTKVDIKMEVYVSTDKVLHEKCILLNEDDVRQNVTLNFHAKVLSKDKGTPLLKKGIHCIEHAQDEESEYGGS